VTVLKASERDYVERVFKLVEDPVKVTLFIQDPEGQASRETRQLFEELATISDKIEFIVLNYDSNKNKAESLGVNKIPGTVIEGSKDYGIRYFGAPSGYMISSVIESILQISKQVSELTENSRKILSGFGSPMNIQVFVSSDSPYCPALVNLAQRMAIEKDDISAHMIDIKEFPHLAMRYNITDVPASVINNAVTIEGALDEKDFINRIKQEIK
jgi:glutaredoxin-like protein